MHKMGAIDRTIDLKCWNTQIVNCFLGKSKNFHGLPKKTVTFDLKSQLDEEKTETRVSSGAIRLPFGS